MLKRSGLLDVMSQVEGMGNRLFRRAMLLEKKGSK